MRIFVGIGGVAALLLASVAIARSDLSGHGEGIDHTARDGTRPKVLREPGQGAFAALSEVVRVLQADPQTDWSRVDLAGLRVHLVDMDRLVSDAVVAERDVPNGILATATGDRETRASLRRMVPAHAAQLGRDDRWTVAASDTVDGVELRVTSDDPLVVARIRGLGFFGLMASRDHHREHHLMIARGNAAHGN